MMSRYDMRLSKETPIRRSDVNIRRQQHKAAGNHVLRAGALALTAVLLAGQAAGAAARKEETVFVLADAAGSPEKIIVSDWLDNVDGEDVLQDASILSDIVNLKGDEAFSAAEDGGIEWASKGNDIFYQGTADADLPVTVSVTCFLDGEEISPEEIAGRSGQVTIRYDYQNHEEREADVAGEKTVLHVPFLAVSGFLLDENVMHDVQVTNGRILTDGEHSVAVGIALPGLAGDIRDNPAYASLLQLAGVDLPDYVEITGQAENFAWGTGYTVVTNEFFSASDPDASSLIDGLFGKLGLLKTGITQISGSAASLNEEAEELKTGSASLADGLETLDGNSEELRNGAEEILLDALGEVQTQLTASDIPVKDLTVENYEAEIGSAMEKAQGEKREMLSAALEKLNGLRDFYNGVIGYTDGVSEAKQGADTLRDGSAALQSGTAGLVLGTGLLETGVPDLSGVSEALKQTIAAGESYNSYSGIAEGMEGKVRFIWKIAGIGA